MFSTARGVAVWPSTAWATSPGRISVATKMTTEAAQMVSSPSASRRRTRRTSAAMTGRSGEVDLLRDAQAGQHRGFHETVQVVDRAEQEIVEHRDDLAAVLRHHALQLGVHLLALVEVELAARLPQQLVEVLAFPERLVPGGIRLVGDGQHQIGGRPPAPVRA